MTNILHGSLVEVALEASQGENKLPRFSMVAYTGGPMKTSFSRNQVVVDLQGMSIPSQNLPIRLQHDAALGVGHCDAIKVDNGQLKAFGVISRDTSHAREVVASAKNGFPWQASIGAEVESFEYLKEGVTARVNGQTIVGPMVIVTKSTLNEISFVDLGADRRTTANVAASALGIESRAKETDMFDKWLHAKGFDPASLSDAQRDTLKAAFDSEQKKVETPTDASPIQAAAPVVQVDLLKTARESMAAETERVAAIRAACNGKHPKIEAQAIRENWNADKVSLEVLRAERPVAVPNIINLSAPQTTSNVICAAIAKAGKMPNIEKQFSAADLEASDRAYKGGISLQKLLLQAAWNNGYSDIGINRSNMRDVLKAAFSTMEIPGILSSSANKFLLEGFMSVETAWREIAAIRSVVDFKTVTRYRLAGSMQYEKVAPSGELKHGTLSEESYTNKADTYGIMFGISRQDIINDDLGALTEVPRRIGRGGALKINDIFWAAFLNNSAFFTSGRANYADGAATVLGVDSLATADQMFADQTDPDGKPLGLAPAILLVPNALKLKAKQLMMSTELRDTTASTKYPTSNPFAGQFRPVSSAYLGNSSYVGYSAKKWYLLANPAELSTIEVAFLNGQESPTIESAEADFNQLGVQMRGYHDFGVALAEYRAGVAMKGEA